jgi:acetyl-CoA carboxylase biotin carboxyl carrier protein
VTPNGEDPLLHYTGIGAADIADLFSLLADTDVSELEVSVGNSRLSLRRPPVVTARAAAPTAPCEPPSLAIASPLVGIFRPAVKRGEKVQPGQTIGAIEALGMPTSVDAPQSGTVEDVLVADGSPVEYGQPLLTLRRGLD